jgi:hypothetical protein
MSAPPPNTAWSIEVKGRVLRGQDLKDHAEKHGLCTICGLYQTHKKVGIFFNKFLPDTITNDKGKTTVYKGHCIQPTCYTSVEQVQEILGEIPKPKRKSPQNREFPSAHQPYLQKSPQNPEFSSAHQPYLRNPHSTLEIPFNPDEPYNGMKSPPLRESDFGGSDPQSAGFESRENSSSLCLQTDANSSKAGAKPTELIVGSALPQPSIPEGSQKENPVIAALWSSVSDGDYITFLNDLDFRGKEAHIVLKGFSLFRLHVVKDQLAKPYSVILGGEGWVKTMITVVERFQVQKQRDVVVSGLATLLTLSSLPGDYKKPMVRKGAVDLVLKMMQECRDDQEITSTSCAIFMSLAMSGKGGLNAKSYPKIATLIRELVGVVNSPDHSGRELALRALFHLANQRRTSEVTGKAASHDVINALAGEASRGIIDIIQTGGMCTKVVEAGMCLLWRMSFPKKDDRIQILPVTEDLIGSIVRTMRSSPTLDVMEAGCGILANMSLRKGFPSEWAHQAVEVICQFLSKPANRDEGVAICAVHALCNLLSNSATKAIVTSNPLVVQTILSLLHNYCESGELVEHACLAISHAGREDQLVKESLMTNGGFGLVRNAFEIHVTSRGEDPSMQVKDAALCAMATFSGSQTGALQIVHTGLLGKLEAILAVEPDKDFQAILEAIVRNTQAGSANGFATRGFATRGHGVLRQQPELFGQLLKNSGTEDGALSLLRELRELGQSGMVGLGDRGLDTLLLTMAEYSYSPEVQEAGCAILAEACYDLPLANLDAPIQFSDGKWAVFHKKLTIDAIHHAMSSHRNHSGVQRSSCCALINLLSPLCEKDPSSSDRQKVRQWVEPCLKDVLDAMSIHQADEKVQESGISLFWTLSLLCGGDDLKRWSLRILQRIFDSMNLFPNVTELNLAACDLLMGLQNDKDSLELMGNSTCIASLMAALGGDNSDVANRASAVLASLLSQVYTASNQVMQVPDAIQKLIFCLKSNELDPQIQVNICLILESLVNFEEYSVVSIAESGALHVLCEAMNDHRTHVQLIEHSCRVMSSIIPSIDPNTMSSMKTTLGKTLIELLKSHMGHAEVESAIMEALWTCCGQDDYFKHILINESSMLSIVQTMTLQLGSAELQRCGCSLLWLLSGYGHGKQMIGECEGISAIVNALLAHNQSTAVQKEGMTALKNLATAPCNKPRLTKADGEITVLCSLRINYLDPLVISSALSALNNMAVDSETRTVSTMREEILDCIISAMGRFPAEEPLQKNACFYLKSCSYLPANLQMMNQRSAKLIPLLQRAAANFPPQCHGRAIGVISKMQKF